MPLLTAAEKRLVQSIMAEASVSPDDIWDCLCTRYEPSYVNMCWKLACAEYAMFEQETSIGDVKFDFKTLADVADIDARNVMLYVMARKLEVHLSEIVRATQDHAANLARADAPLLQQLALLPSDLLDR